MTRLTRHIRSNAVAYLALFVALGGTSYAALHLPANSVGGRQIRNHVIDPVKLNPKYIAGSVRAWASVNAKGKIVASSGGAKIVASVGADQITWTTKQFYPHCLPTVTVNNPTGPGGPRSPRSPMHRPSPARGGRLAALVSTFSDVTQTPHRQPYVVSVHLSPPAAVSSRVSQEPHGGALDPRSDFSSSLAVAQRRNSLGVGLRDMDPWHPG